jgi:hypothetical protein
MTQQQLQQLLLDEIFTFEFEIVDNCSQFDPIRFSFMNQYGTRDYFTFTLRNNETDTIERQNYYKNIGSWSEANYNIEPLERGWTTYAADIETNYVAETDWLDDDISRWLRELFLSTDVKVWFEGEFIPVVLTNTTYDVKTIARQKLYRHIITFRHAIKKKVI